MQEYYEMAIRKIDIMPGLMLELLNLIPWVSGMSGFSSFHRDFLDGLDSLQKKHYLSMSSLSMLIWRFGLVSFYGEWNFEKAEVEFRRSIE